ncbi:MAG: DUF4388 domain-containing protein [Deltaproteobacteria bacterium]|nr:DUF4388 domain-containing protein [Deltaproteobacteria bacterium]
MQTKSSQGWAMASLSGDLDLMPLSDVAAWLGNRKLSATVQVKRRQVVNELTIRSGKILYTASSDPREYLGQHLINFGYIREEQLQKAFQTHKETKVPLGRVLVMVEAVTQEQLARVLVFKARESVLEAMCWAEGTFRVTSENTEDEDLDFDIPIDLLEVHSEGEARRRMWQEIRRVFPSDATRCEVLDVPSDLSAFDKRLLTLLSQYKSIGETSLELRSMDFQTYARLYDLHNRKTIRPLLEEVNDDFNVDEADIVSEEVAANRTGLKAKAPQEAPGVAVPAEAQNPGDALRVALAGRNWKEALLLADRIIEMDPTDVETLAARRVAEAQVKKMQGTQAPGGGVDVNQIPKLAVPRSQLAVGHLTSKERYVLSRIDGIRSLAEIAQLSSIQKDELLRIVEAFVQRKTIQLT